MTVLFLFLLLFLQADVANAFDLETSRRNSRALGLSF